MEIIFEILFELIFEGSLEIGTSKKAPLLLRIFASAFFIIIVGGFLALFLLMAMSVMKDTSVVLGIVLILFDIFMLGCVIFKVRKRIKKGDVK